MLALKLTTKKVTYMGANLWLNKEKIEAYLNESKENTPAKITTIALLQSECLFAAILGEDVSLMIPDCCLLELIDSKGIYLTL
jgi:hypothetical protein